MNRRTFLKTIIGAVASISVLGATITILPKRELVPKAEVTCYVDTSSPPGGNGTMANPYSSLAEWERNNHGYANQEVVVSI